MEAEFTRDPEDFNGVYLSVQASKYHYCIPRTGIGLPLDSYSTVELAILDSNKKIRRPEGLLSADLCDLWEPGDVPVAGWVSQEDVERIREQLRHG